MTAPWSREVSAAEEESLETEGAAGDDTRFAEHVALLRKVVAGEERLGRKPEELAEVVTELALGAPGSLAARSLAATGCSEPLDRAVRQRGAAMVAEGFRTLLRQPTAMGLVQREGLAYWRATLRYAVAGCLQTVLDEHFHQVWGQLAWKNEALDDKALDDKALEVAERTSPLLHPSAAAQNTPTPTFHKCCRRLALRTR